MQPVFNTQAPRKAVNLSVNADLLSRAGELSINLSATLEQALIHVLAQRCREEWRVRNRDAIEVYNEHVEMHGVFSAGVRSF